jgi:hypothetical protein
MRHPLLDGASTKRSSELRTLSPCTPHGVPAVYLTVFDERKTPHESPIGTQTHARTRHVAVRSGWCAPAQPSRAHLAGNRTCGRPPRQRRDGSVLRREGQGRRRVAFADPGQIHWSSPGLLDISTDECIVGLRRLTDAVHTHGMAMFQQIWHGGPPQLPPDSSAPWSASHVSDPGLNMLPVPMTRAMIDELTAGFVSDTLRVRQAGIDGRGVSCRTWLPVLGVPVASDEPSRRRVRWHAAQPQPLAHRCDHRSARGSRSTLSNRCPVFARRALGSHHSRRNIIAVVEWLEAAGLIDFVDVSLGSHYRRHLLMGAAHEPPGCQLATSEKITRRTTLPTIVTGRFTNLQQADDVIASGTMSRSTWHVCWSAPAIAVTTSAGTPPWAPISRCIGKWSVRRSTPGSCAAITPSTPAASCWMSAEVTLLSRLMRPSSGHRDCPTTVWC